MNELQTLLSCRNYLDYDASTIAPEVLAEIIDEHIGTMPKYKDYACVISTLYRNRDAFKTRIEGTIKDDWMKPETFKPIAPKCLEVLNSLCIEEKECYRLKEWQYKLIAWFKSIC